MATRKPEEKIPKEIPMEPFYYSFLLETVSDRSKKDCIKTALDKYNKSCMRAYRLLLKELKKCKEE